MGWVVGMEVVMAEVGGVVGKAAGWVVVEEVGFEEVVEVDEAVVEKAVEKAVAWVEVGLVVGEEEVEGVVGEEEAVQPGNFPLSYHHSSCTGQNSNQRPPCSHH